jgi:hypothetical protein
LRKSLLFSFAALTVLAIILAIAAVVRVSQSAGSNTNTRTAPALMVSTVPFVGCASDGQSGPVPAPEGTSKVVPISAEVARRLAYYESEAGFGVLGPRGWHCFGTYGSSGDALYVSPRAINPDTLFSGNWDGLAGSVILLSRKNGGSSGRYAVAEIIARIFPAHRAFVRDVIAEGGEPASTFALGPYPNDELLYRSNEAVEYKTPPYDYGLGTQGLKPNGDSISGVAILSGVDTDLVTLSVRLSSEQPALITSIVQQVERDVADHQQAGQRQASVPKPFTDEVASAPSAASSSDASMGYPVSEEVFVNAYILANIGRDSLSESELERLAHAEYQMGRQIDTQTLLIGGDLLGTRGKRTMDYLDRLHRK